jgi:hypothetical protein
MAALPVEGEGVGDDDRAHVEPAMSGPVDAASPTAEGDGVLLPVGDRHAVALTWSAEVDLSRVGKAGPMLPPGALARVAAAAGVVAEGATLPARLVGRLVELDPQSVALVRSGRQAVEAGGWVQGNLRNNGKYARVARFRPATAFDVATGVANIVGTVAAQAQLAAIHRDVARTLHEVQNVSAFQHAELVAAIHSDAEDVRRWVELMHETGSPRRAIDAADRAGERLRTHRLQCLSLAVKAVQALEAAAAADTPLGANKQLTDTTAVHARQYLELAAAAHVAAVQAEVLGVAELLAAGDPAASAHAKSLLERARREHEQLVDLRVRADKARQGIDATFGGLLDHFGRTLKPMVPSWKRPVAGAGVFVATALAGATPAAVLAGAGAGVAAFRQKGAQGGLEPLIADLQAADPQLEGHLVAAHSLLALIADITGLDPDLLPGSRTQAASQPSGPANRDLLDRVIAMLAERDGWVHAEQIRRIVNVTPGSLTRVLGDAAAEGLLETRPSPTRFTRGALERVIECRSADEGRPPTAS